MKYVWNVLIAATQGLNALTGGNPDQSFSGQTALSAKQGSRLAIIREAFIDLLFSFFGQRHHCENAIEYDELNTPETNW